VRNFPFDRQTLTLDLGIVGSDAPACGVDRAGSGYDKRIAPEGWRIAAFDVERHTRESATDFSDPVRSGTRSAQEHVLVTVEFQLENRKLRRANEILKAASVFFAAELDPRPKS
jgi:hypothetical protein